MPTPQQPQVTITGTDLAGLLAGIAGAGATTTSPIGVPPGYVAPISDPESGGFSPGSGPAITVRDYRESPYNEGDDWAPASQSPEVIAELQQRMSSGGLLTSSYRIGVWDDASRSAYRDLLGYANSLGTTDDFALRRWSSVGAGVKKAPRAPLIAEVSNPLDIKAALRSTLKERLGQGNIDEAKLDAMVAAYQGTEKQFQQQEYDLQGDGTPAGGTGGTVVRPPDATAFADEQAKKLDPTAYDAYRVLDKFSVLEKELTGR